VLVFLSTCKQVKYVYEMLRRLRPGVPLRCIHGKLKQMKRMAVFQDFCEVGAATQETITFCLMFASVLRLHMRALVCACSMLFL